MMLDNLPDPQAIAAALQRAAVHWAKAGYELAAGVGAFIDELVGGGDEAEGSEGTGPTRIEVD
jgi:hypothetical protein